MALPSIFRIPRPKTFLYLVSLRTATEFIILTLAFNKVSGFYGILALLTGYALSPLQLSMYIYSVVILGLIAYLSPSIRSQSPLPALALCWIYLLDSAVNAAYTALFGLSWFVLLAQHLGDSDPTSGMTPGGKMMNDTAGFTDPEVSVGEVDVIATPADGLMPGQDAVAVGHGDGSSLTLSSAVFQSGSIASLTVICLLWTIKLYFCLVVMAYARGVLRQYIVTTSVKSTDFGLAGGSDDATLAENPFRPGREEGEGWRGKLGRAMAAFPKSYWLGKDDDDAWIRGTGDRFKNAHHNLRLPMGTGERERRARSGTGPPKPINAGKTTEA